MDELEAMSIPDLQDIARDLNISQNRDDDKQTLIYAILDRQSENIAASEDARPKRRSRIGETTPANRVYTANTEGRTKQRKSAPTLTLADGMKPKRGRPSKADLAAREAARLAAIEAENVVAQEEEALPSENVVPAATEEVVTEPATTFSNNTYEDLPHFLSEHLNNPEAIQNLSSSITDLDEIRELISVPAGDSIKSDVQQVGGEPITDTDFVIVQDLPIYQSQPAYSTYNDDDSEEYIEYSRPKFRRFKDDPLLSGGTKEAAQMQDTFVGASLSPVGTPANVTTGASHYTAPKTSIPTPTLSYSGVLEIMQEGYGFLRSAEYNYLVSPDDVYVSAQQIRQYSLKVGDVVDCTVRLPHEGEQFYVLMDVTQVNGLQPSAMRDRVAFEHLTPLFPEEKFKLCSGSGDTLSRRIVDLFTPIGKGQRALIVAQPKTGKTMLMKDIANAIAQNNPETYLMMLLIDERPEEVTDMARTVKAEVIASTFDEPAAHHVKIAGLVLEKAKRLVECGHDVVIFLDSITRLARAYNTVAPTSGKVLTGGVDANALQKPKRFFGAARNIENGGSLTIIATALIDTGSKMDEVIFEEFKGTGNMELQLERILANKRIFPAVNLVASSTRRDDLLMDAQTVNRMHILRNYIADMNPMEAITDVRRRIESTRNNDEFILSMNG